MTIEVQIFNKDDILSIEVESQELNRDTGRRANGVFYSQTIGPGNNATFHVYHLRDLLIREAIPVPALKPAEGGNSTR